VDQGLPPGCGGVAWAIIGTMSSAFPKLATGLFLGLLAVLATGCGTSANKAGGDAGVKPVVLTLADPDRGRVDVQEYIDAVHRISAGGVRIDDRGGWRGTVIDYDRAVLADLRAGKVDLAKIAVRSLDELGVTDFQPLQAPMLIDSLALERAVIDGPIPARLLPRLRRLGVVGVAVLPGALRRPFGRHGSLASPTALQGATFGIRPSLVAAAAVRALGARPLAYRAGTFPSALDGAELDLTTLEGAGFDVPGSTITSNVNLWPRMFVVVANANSWRSLSPAQRAVLRRAGHAALAPAIRRVHAANTEEARVLCNRKRLAFVTSSPEQLAAYRRELRPAYAAVRRSAPARALLNEIATLKRRLGVAADRLPACATHTPTDAKATASAIDGVYRATTTEDELRRAGAAADELIPENYGTWIFVFDHGRFADTQENASSCTWGYGTYRITGAQVAWSFAGGGGLAPNGAYNRPGEFFRFGWSRYRDLLTLSRVPGSISPANFRAAPYRLISSTPSRAAFSKRCPPPPAALRR
jgi:TRAP-type C4-dicarboxylate transport system substrate-binding protein